MNSRAVVIVTITITDDETAVAVAWRVPISSQFRGVTVLDLLNNGRTSQQGGGCQHDREKTQ
jgi:hypothetical protein